MRHKLCQLLILNTALLAALGLPALAWAQQSPPYPGPHMWSGGWYGWVFGPIMMIGLITVAVLLVLLLVRWVGGIGPGRAAHTPQDKTPLDILKDRFARGEIDKEEFEERRKVLDE